MASALKSMVGKAAEKATGADTDDSEDIKAAMGKYLLRITAGPSYDLSTHSPVFVNTDTPTLVENEHMVAKIKVRIRGYEGLPRGSTSHSKYFDHPNHTSDQWSIGFSFIPKHDIVASETAYGADFDHPVRDRLPPRTLIDMGWKIFRTFIDPGAEMDAYGDEPYLLGPTLSTWYVLRIGEKVRGGADKQKAVECPSEDSPVTEGADGEEATAIREKFNMPTAPLKRRKHFLTAKNQEGFLYEKDRLYMGDFHNPYIDFQQFKVKLPGLSIGVAKYINDKTHVLRWVFKNTKSGEVYFVVCFTLLHGDDVDKGLKEDRQRREQERQGSVSAETGVGVDGHNDTPKVQSEEPSKETASEKQKPVENAVQQPQEDVGRADKQPAEASEEPTAAEAGVDNGSEASQTSASVGNHEEHHTHAADTNSGYQPRGSRVEAMPNFDLPVREGAPDQTDSQQENQQDPQQASKHESLIQGATGVYKPGSAIADTDVGKEMLQR